MKDKVLYLVIGVLLGVIIMQWAQGPQVVRAQAPEAITGYRVVIDSRNYTHHYVMLSNGDVYRKYDDSTWANPPTFLGNFWTGAQTPTSDNTWGAVKGMYEGEKK